MRELLNFRGDILHPPEKASQKKKKKHLQAKHLSSISKNSWILNLPVVGFVSTLHGFFEVQS